MDSTLEDLLRSGMADMILNAMRNNEGAIKEMLRILQENQRYEQGLDNFIEAIDEGKTSNAQLGGMVKTLAKVQKDQASAIRQLTFVALTLIASGELSSAAAKVACKLGHGKEALQEMFREKMKGRM